MKENQAIYGYLINCCFLRRKRSTDCQFPNLRVYWLEMKRGNSYDTWEAKFDFETKKKKKRKRYTKSPAPRALDPDCKSQEQTITEPHPAHHPNAQL